MYHRVQRLLLATLIGSSAVPIAAQNSELWAVADDSILDIVKSNSDAFSALERVLVAADLDAMLDDDDESVTVFAPLNSAFNDLPQALMTKLLDAKWKPQLQDVLLYHLLQGKVFSDDLTDGLALTENFQSDAVTVSISPSIMINDANVVVEPKSFDISASNGVIHGIDAVLTPPSISHNLVNTVVADDRLGTLVTALKAVDGLVDALAGDGPFTVFAPTDEAFGKLADGLVDTLLADTDLLKKVLQYHVLGDENLASYMLSDTSVDTVEGSAIEIDVSRVGVMLNNDAKVIDADYIANNGIVHVIDTVLIPPNFVEPFSSSKSGKGSKIAKSAKKQGKQKKKKMKKKKKKKRNKKKMFH